MDKKDQDNVNTIQIERDDENKINDDDVEEIKILKGKKGLKKKKKKRRDPSE